MGRAADLTGAGQKSGIYFALDPDNGSLVWSQILGPGGENGAMEYGSAVDDHYVYVAEADAAQVNHVPPFYTLPSGQVINYGSVAALDRATGRIVWQVPSPVGTVPCPAGSPVTCGGYHTAPTTVANGVVSNCARDALAHMFAFDAATGALLWSFASGGSCGAAGAAVVKGTVYWDADGPSPGLSAFGV
jgi:polyvinyl alcohol dehydrogenase (cytochrome)